MTAETRPGAVVGRAAGTSGDTDDPVDEVGEHALADAAAAPAGGGPPPRPSRTPVAPADDEILPRRGRRSVLVTVGVAGIVMAAFFFLLVGAKQPDAKSNVVGKPAPSTERSFETLAGGSRVRVADFAGRYVFLNFFASWCVPCEKEHPELVRFQQRHAALGDATVVQVLYNDKPSAARDFFRLRGEGGWPLLIDEEGQFALDYGVTGPPETFLIDPQGNVLAGVKSAINEAGLDDLLTRAKQGRP